VHRPSINGTKPLFIVIKAIIVFKHSDYFVWKDTSERETWRCEDTIDKKLVNSCTLKCLFLRQLSNQRNCPKFPEMLSSTRYKCHVFKNLGKTTFVTALRVVSINEWIWINSGTKILRCSFLQWLHLSLRRDDEQPHAVGCHSIIELRLGAVACNPSSCCCYWVLDHLCSNLSQPYHSCWITETRSLNLSVPFFLLPLFSWWK